MEKLTSQQSRWWDWAAVSLHFILLQIVASRLVATTWTPFLSLIQTFTYMGFIVGVALGYSQFQRRIASWLSFLYMLILLPIQWTLIINQQASLEEQFLSVFGRLYFTTSDFVTRHPVEDPIFFVAIMSIAFWIISSWAGFTLIRSQNYLGAVLPAAIGLLIIQNYDHAQSRLWFLAIFAFIALLLLGRLQFLKNKLSWRERRIFLSPDNTVDLTSSMTVAAGLIILVAWSIPASLTSMESAAQTWMEATRPWREFTERMENAVSALESPGGGRRGEFFGSQLALGRGFPLSDLVMFEVEVPDVSSELKPPRYYWRGRTYDRFVNGQWYMTGTVREEYSPAVVDPFHVANLKQSPAHFVFKTGNSTFSLLYAPSQPIWISRPGITFATPADHQSKDIIAWHAYPALRGGETYQLDADLKNPNRQQLQEAGTNYPEWITQKYLQLPKGFSPRIQELAQEITRNAATPYEKSQAITSYLRENITYKETIAEPPRNRDRLEWILFDYKQAYCVYYASAEIMMLRSVGVPARMAVGFTQGERDGNTYTVRRFNAHAWPEVYFPNIGWVEFEPTAGQDPLDRPLPRLDSENLNNPNPRSEILTEGNQALENRDPLADVEDVAVLEDTPSPLGYLLPLLVVFGALLVYLSRRYAWHTHVPVLVRATFERTGIDAPIWVVRWEKWVKLSPIEKAFESINFGLRQLDQAVPVHVTPIERAAKLTSLLPAQADQIKILLDEHQTSLYTSRSADATQARHAASNLRKQVIIERIRSLFLGKPLR